MSGSASSQNNSPTRGVGRPSRSRRPAGGCYGGLAASSVRGVADELAAVGPQSSGPAPPPTAEMGRTADRAALSLVGDDLS